MSVGDGKNVVCTFTNTRETGTIQVVKHLSPTDDPGKFNLFVKQGATTIDSATDQTHNGSTSLKTVNTGTYQVSETGGTGTDLNDYSASLSCTDEDGAVTSTGGNVAVRFGKNVVCTFTNTRETGTIELQKHLSPTDDPGLFDLTIKQGTTTIDSENDASHNDTTGANTVNTGTYQVSEAAGTDTDLDDYDSSLSCSDQDGTVTSTGGNVAVGDGKNVVCTFTNTRETGTIELRKHLSPTDDPGLFDLTIKQGSTTIDSENDASHNDTTGANTVNTGTYQVSEAAGTDTDLDDYQAALSCTDEDGAVDSTGGNVAVGDGKDVVCTFTNTRETGSIELRKELSPTDDPGKFDLFIKHGSTTVDSASDQGDDGTTGANTVNTGTYSVSEAAGTDTDLDDYQSALSCTDEDGAVDSTGGDVAVRYGKNVVCTFTNTRETGSIELQKHLSPTDDPGKFDLTIKQGSTTVDSATDQGHNGTTGANTVNTGTYSVSEAAGTDTDLDDYQSALSCTDEDGAVDSTGGDVAVRFGKHVVCTFTNTRETGTIELRKHLSPTDDPGVFDLAIKQGATTIDSENDASHNDTTGANTVNTGTYQVSEAAGTDTDLDDYSSSLSCTDEDGAVDSTGGDVAVRYGKNVVCTFTNTRETGTIELQKHLSPTDDPGLFDLTIKHGSTTVDSVDDASHNDTTGANTVNTGTYQVSEAAGTDTDLDDYQAALSCTDQDGAVDSTGGNVAVGDGKDVVCTFTNTRETGTIELQKHLSPTDDPGLFDLTIKQGSTTIDSEDDASHNDTTGANTVNTGTYQVSEAAGTDTDLDDYQAALSCTDEDGAVDSTGGNVAVRYGKNVVCTFTNTRETGTIELQKHLSPTDDPGLFDLTIKQGSTTVDSAADQGHNGTTGANTVNTGTYSVSEAAGTDTDLDDYQAALSCTDEDGAVDSTGGDVAVRYGKNVVCTFTNTRETGTIELRKHLSPTDDPGLFDLTIKQGSTTIDSKDDATHNGTTGANTVNTGTYQVSEAAGTDTDLDDYQAALSCTDEDGAVTSTGGNVAVRYGKNVVCTFTNTRETGTIELQKHLSPTDDPGLFDLTIKQGATTIDSKDDATHNGTTGANTVNTGTYHVSEAAGTDTDLDDYHAALACEDQDGVVDSTGGDVAVGYGKNVVCTFTNTRETGTIELRKHLSPTDDPGLFDLTIKQGSTTIDSKDDATHNGTTGANTVDTGTYQVSEAAGTDTDLDDYHSSLECTDESGTISSTGGNVSVADGRTVVCTFTNSRETGTIELRKHLSPTDDPGLFDLTIKQGSTTIDSKDDATHNGTTGANTVDTGTYQVSEAAGTDTDLDDYQSSLACTDESGTISSTGGNVSVADGRTVVCTFTNTRETGTIKVVKHLSPTDDPGLFDLTVKQGATVVDSATDQTHNGSTSVKTVNTGTYQVSEAAGTDTDLDDYQSALSCTDEDGAVSSTGGDVAVRYGKNVVCTFTNTRETGTIELQKHLSPTDDPGLFDLTIKQGSTTIDSKDDATHNGTTGANTVNTGTYQVSEAAGTDTDLDDYQSSLECSDESGTISSTGGNVSVADGRTVVCTFTNTRETGTIELRKHLSPTDDPGLFDLTITHGATPVDSKDDASHDDTTGANPVNTGTYHVAEAAGTDTDLDDYHSSLECTDETGTISSTGGDVAVADGKNVVCTFTNTRETGTIELQKHLSPTDDPGVFDLTIKQGSTTIDSKDDASHNDSTGANTVNTGTYQVSEAAGTNTDLDDYQAALSCTDEDGAVDSTGGNVAVRDGKDVVCVFTNTRETGSIELRKEISPDNDPGVFNLFIKQGSNTIDSATDVGHGASTGPNTVNTGTYTVSEAGGTNTNLDDYGASLSCTDEDGAVASSGGNVNVRFGKHVVCTFVNTRETGTIELRKELSPTDDPGVFDLTIKQGANTIDSKDDASHNDTTGSTKVNTGTYQVSEAGGTDTDLDDYHSSLACEDQDGPVSSTGGSVAVGTDKDVVCTFTNTRKTGTIELRKELSPTNDPGKFDLKIEHGQTTVDTKDDAGHNDTTGANTVNTGTYHVSESAGTSTDLDDYNAALECEDENGPVSSTGGDVAVGDGQDVVCTFTNTRKTGTIEVKKALSPTNDPGRFNLQIDGGTQKSNAGDGDTTGEKTVNTGNHTVSEAQGSNGSLSDYQKSIVCTDTSEREQQQQSQQVAATSGDSAGPLTVPVTEGADIVCTITNVRETGTIELRKALKPSSDAGVFDLTIKLGSTTVAVKKDAGDGGTTGQQTVNTGTYDVSEAAGTGTDAADYKSSLECSDQAGPISSTGGTVTIGHGNNVVCTFTNERLDPAIAIDKTGPATATAGELVEFTIVITNPGDQPLTGIDVNDNRCVSKPALQAKNRGAGVDASPDTLDPGDSWVYTCSGQTQSGQTAFENTATVTATDGRHTVTANDTHTVTLTQLVIAGERVTPGSARLGGRTGCQARPFTVRVKGKSILRVEFSVDGKKKKTVLAADKAGRWTYKVDPRKYKAGRHKLVARTVFNPDSGTRAKNLTLKFSRCVRAAQAPAFTG